MVQISGKPISQVIAEIKAPCDAEKKQVEGYSYYEIKEYENRLNKVVGREHYSTSYTEPQFFTLPNGQIIVCINAKITITDDDGKVALTACGVGTNEIKRSKDHNTYLHINNMGYNTQLDAFISACKDLNMFDLHSIASDEVSTNPLEGTKSKTPSKKADNSSKPISSKKERFWVESDMEEIGSNAEGKPTYKLSVRLAMGSQVSEKVYYLLFYPNQYASYISVLNQLYMDCRNKKKQYIRCIVKNTTNNDDTFVVCGFWEE